MDRLTGKRKLKRDQAIQDYQKATGASQETIAERYGISQGQVSKILSVKEAA